MKFDHHHPGRECDGLCHLNERARRRFWELMRGGCPEQAERLRVEGVWV